MTQKRLTAEAELLSMRERAEKAVQNIDRLSCDIDAERQSLRQTIKEYNAKRVELFKQELRARGMTWCTRCDTLTPESEAKFMLIEGKRHEEAGDCYGLESFSELHRACPKCYKRAMDKHGWMGPYDTMAKDQLSFYAFSVEKRKDDSGFYVRRYGDWMKLDDEHYRLDEEPPNFLVKIVEQWGFPPGIEVRWRAPGTSGDKLIIHEQVEMAKAS